MKTIWLCALLSTAFNLFSQNPDINRTKHWYFGNGAGLDFTSGNPVADINSSLHTIESSAVMSDTAGNLLFYTDGDTVWNKNHQPMPNGTGLLGCGNWQNSSTQGVLIVPQPISNNIYYIFTTDCYENSGASAGLNYSIVDMNLDGGLGDIISINNLLYAPSSEKLAAVYHCNKQDVWIVSHARDSCPPTLGPPGKFYTYLLTNAGINITPIISSIGSPINCAHGMAGPIKFSPDGNNLICVNFTPDSTWNYALELFDFDSNTGIISNPIGLSNEIYLYGGCFSPDGSKIYVSTYDTYFNKIYQYDITSGNQAAIIASRTIISNNNDSIIYYNQLQNAPDGKIYIARWNNTNFDSLAVIQNPNNAVCNFLFNGVSLQGRIVNYGLPNFIDSYFDPTPAIPCNIGYEEFELNSVGIYPNPFNMSTTVSINTKSQRLPAVLKFYDLLGKSIISLPITFIEGKYLLNRNSLSDGMYLLKIEYQNNSTSKKVIITK